MRGLILKDFQIADIIFIYLCFGDAQTSVFSGDERKVWANYIMSSPSTARGQVRSKYCESVFLSVLCALWCICLLNLQDALSDTDTSLKLVILLFFLQFILRALEFPFFIRFGSRHGNYYKLGLLLLIGFLLLILASCIGKEPKDLKGKIVTVQLNDFKNRYGEDLTRQSSGVSL